MPLLLTTHPPPPFSHLYMICERAVFHFDKNPTQRTLSSITFINNMPAVLLRSSGSRSQVTEVSLYFIISSFHHRSGCSYVNVVFFKSSAICFQETESLQRGPTFLFGAPLSCSALLGLFYGSRFEMIGTLSSISEGMHNTCAPGDASFIKTLEDTMYDVWSYFVYLSKCWLFPHKRIVPLMHQYGRSISLLHANKQKKGNIWIPLFGHLSVTQFVDRGETFASFCMVYSVKTIH